MRIYWLVLLAVCCQTCLKGSRILVSLFAIELGASTFWIGALIALYGFCPIFLAIYAGRLSDRLGVRVPMAFGTLGVGLGLLAPYLFGSLPVLFVSAGLIGASFIFFQVSFQNLIGSLGGSDERARNYSISSLGAAISSFLAPVMTGVWIDTYGYGTTYGLLSILAGITAAGVLVSPFARGHGRRKDKENKGDSIWDLVASRSLRRTLIVSGVIITGVNLYSFYMPIYGHGIGFSASRIGVVMGSYAVAAFVIRIAMPAIVRTYEEDRILTGCLLLSGAAFVLFPFFKDLPTLVGLSFVLGLGLGCGQPLSIMMTYNSSPEGRSGEALGLRLTSNKGIQVAVPLLFGSVGSAFGLFPVFWATAVFFLAGGVLNARRKPCSEAAEEAPIPSAIQGPADPRD
jgi:MFS family permease